MIQLPEGIRIFYRRLASELHVQVGPPSALLLELVGPSGFPDEDVRHLTKALALIDSQGLGEVAYSVITPCEPILDPGNNGQVYDLRILAGPAQCADSILRRPDIVFVCDEGRAQLKCRRIRFDRNHRVVFDAVAASFQELIEVLKYPGQALEMPNRYLLRGFRAVAEEFSLFPQPTGGPAAGTVKRLIELVAAGWRYQGQTANPDLVLRWLDQFDGIAREGAVNLLTHINAAGYFSTREIAQTLNDLLALEPRDAQLVSIQPPGKSEQMLLYEMRVANRTIPVSKAVRKNVAKIVCIDDVIGSGDTIVERLFEAPGSDNLSKWLAVDGRAITVLAAICNAGGVRRIEDDPRSLGKIRVRAGSRMDASNGVFSPEANVFVSVEVSTAFRQVCEKLGQHLFPQDVLGWGGCAWDVVTEYNVPDCSLPIIWCEDDNLPWSALFRRR